jgi:hypothetical protein
VYAFPINKFINKRIYLYLGEIYKLPCDAIVVGNVESLTDRSEGNEAIFTLAGVELEPALAVLAPCTTGDSCVTSGFQMPCEWIIHSVGPRYDPRFLNAAEHALFSAYKSALVLAVEKNVQRLVLGTVYQRPLGGGRVRRRHVLREQPGRLRDLLDAHAGLLPAQPDGAGRAGGAAAAEPGRRVGRARHREPRGAAGRGPQAADGGGAPSVHAKRGL